MTWNQNNLLIMKYQHMRCLFAILVMYLSYSEVFMEKFPFTFGKKIASGGCGSVYRGKRKFDPKQTNEMK